MDKMAQQDNNGYVPVPDATPIQSPAYNGGGGGAPIMKDYGLQRGDAAFYDRQPQRIQCQFCNHDVATVVTFQNGTGTHLTALGTCLIGCIPCCLMAYCVDGVKDAVHQCPNCQRVVGAKRLI